MIKKYSFYIILIIIYLLFLGKDNIVSHVNIKDLNTFYENTKDNYYKSEYNRLLKILNLKDSNYNLIYTKAITRDIYEFFDKITILKGKKDNLKSNSLVINEEGLVGIITKVYDSYSEVALLTNNKINLSVKLGNSYGILCAKDNRLYVKNVKTNNKININDKVYTSGLTKHLEGVLIGSVTSIKKDNLDLEYILEIKPSANYYNLNYLGVITSWFF